LKRALGRLLHQRGGKLSAKLLENLRQNDGNVIAFDKAFGISCEEQHGMQVRFEKCVQALGVDAGKAMFDGQGIDEGRGHGFLLRPGALWHQMFRELRDPPNQIRE
jgi:hypothetical protein